jgi:hypothetical protein
MYMQTAGGVMPYRQTDSSAFRDPSPSRADLIAAELDQRSIEDGARSWIVHVFGVHEDERDLWIQVSDRPDGENGFVLHLSAWATAQHAIAALAAIRPNLLPYPRVVPVMQRT